MMEAARTSETSDDNYFTLIALMMEAARTSETSVDNYFTLIALMMEAVRTSETSVDNYFTLIALMMKAERTSETSVDNYFTRQYIPEDNSELHTRCRENLKSHKIITEYGLKSQLIKVKRIHCFRSNPLSLMVIICPSTTCNAVVYIYGFYMALFIISGCFLKQH
jgi:hypothetical protein